MNDVEHWNNDLDVIEDMLKRRGLANTIDLLANVCSLKADQVRDRGLHLGDEARADAWDRELVKLLTFKDSVEV